MFDLLIELVNKSSAENKSELLSELNKLKESNLITMPKNLDDILSNDKFADLKKDFDSKVGSVRTKWEQELKDKSEKERLEKLKGNPKPKEETEFEKTLMYTLKSMQEKIGGLENQRKTSTLSDYAKEKAKDLPKEFQDLITVNETMTEKDIDHKINLLTTAHENVLKNIDSTPYAGKPKGKEGNVQEWKDALPIKEEQK